MAGGAGSKKITKYAAMPLSRSDEGYSMEEIYSLLLIYSRQPLNCGDDSMYLHLMRSVCQ